LAENILFFDVAAFVVTDCGGREREKMFARECFGSQLASFGEMGLTKINSIIFLKVV
jgi:hypothetical protein